MRGRTHQARRSILAIEVAIFVGLTCCVIVAYAVTTPPFFNPPHSIDPWLYTASWINFDQIYHAFAHTYYAARLPWIIPGYALNSLLDPRAAYFTIHAVFFAVGGLAAYLVVKAYFGRFAAAVTYVWVIGSQMYFGAHRWDYWDGALITFLFLSLFFASPARRLVIPRFAASGFFAAAAITTNLYAILLLVGIPIMYAVTQVERPIIAAVRQVVVDAVSFAAGVGTLLIGCGSFASLNGGPFWFVGPQIHAARTIQSSPYHHPFHAWVPAFPRVVVPLLLLLGSTLALRHVPRKSIAFRAAVGALIYLAVVSVALGAWQVTGGAPLEYSYYFSPLLPAMALCIGVLGSAAGSTLRSRRYLTLVGGVATAAVIVPLTFLYYSDPQHLIGRPAYAPVAVFSAVGLISLVMSNTRVHSRTVTIMLAVGLSAIVASSSYAFDASADVEKLGRSSSNNGQTFDISLDVVRFLHHSVPGDRLPTFWYNDLAEDGTFRAIQSLYYYAYTALGFSLPKWDAHTDEAFRALAPTHIVLLCESRSCHGAVGVLHSHLELVVLKTAAYFAAGEKHIWVRIYAVGQLRPAQAAG